MVKALHSGGARRRGCGTKCRVLDVSTGTGEAARMALSLVGTEGAVVGADISPAMLTSACAGLHGSSFLPVAADGQALPFCDASFDAVVCQLGLQFFPDPAQGVGEFRRVLRKSGRVAICVISTPDRAPMQEADQLGAGQYRARSTPERGAHRSDRAYPASAPSHSSSAGAASCSDSAASRRPPRWARASTCQPWARRRSARGCSRGLNEVPVQTPVNPGVGA